MIIALLETTAGMALRVGPSAQQIFSPEKNGQRGRLRVDLTSPRPYGGGIEGSVTASSWARSLKRAM